MNDKTFEKTADIRFMLTAEMFSDANVAIDGIMERTLKAHRFLR